MLKTCLLWSIYDSISNIFEPRCGPGLSACGTFELLGSTGQRVRSKLLACYTRSCVKVAESLLRQASFLVRLDRNRTGPCKDECLSRARPRLAPFLTKHAKNMLTAACVCWYPWGEAVSSLALCWPLGKLCARS